MRNIVSRIGHIKYIKKKNLYTCFHSNFSFFDYILSNKNYKKNIQQTNNSFYYLDDLGISVQAVVLVNVFIKLLINVNKIILN